jgi:putative molybdopterin biosynthesis protein
LRYFCFDEARMKQKRYLDKKPLEETRDLFLAKLRPFVEAFQKRRVECVAVADALGRITAKPVFARLSSPHYHAAAMDGFAVLADVTFGASESQPRQLKIGKDAHPVDTGAAMPGETNAVIKIEDIHFTHGETIEIDKGAYPWQNVRVTGEDLVAGEMILSENHRIRPYDMGALLAGGVWEVEVRCSPRIRVIPTGSELVEPGCSLRKGNIIEFNSTILKGLMTEDGAEFHRSPIVRDDYEALRSALALALEDSDVVIVIAGSSAGSHDFTLKVLEDQGEVLVHGVSIMPGKPTILGLAQDRPVIGLPGYPVSATIAYEKLVRPLVAALLSSGDTTRRQIRAIPVANITSKLGVDEFLRVRLGRVGSPLIATPLPRGAGLITSLSRADGLIRIDRLSEGLIEGEEVSVELLRNEKQIENRIIMVGSHDLTLDLLATHLSRKYPRYSLSSSHVGSMGGLIAVRKGRAHLAGIHLFDPETCKYNIPFVKNAFGRVGVHLVHLVSRQQGLLVAPGNPKKIKTIKDLIREGVVFVNRQRGSGTRMLFDHLLREHDTTPEAIRGYEREEFTHMAVAVAVLSGTADAGVGVYSAARALDLSFVPLTTERYDLVIPTAFFCEEKIQALLEVIQSDSFRRSVQKMGGYDVSKTGESLNLN